MDACSTSSTTPFARATPRTWSPRRPASRSSTRRSGRGCEPATWSWWGATRGRQDDPALQMARAVARSGGHALFICYEHEETALATRLLALETAGSEDPRRRRPGSRRCSSRGPRAATVGQALAADPSIARASRMRRYADRLTLVRASGAHTDLAGDRRARRVARCRRRPSSGGVRRLPAEGPGVPEPATETEKVTQTVEALKDLALAHHVPVVAVSAVDTAGLEARAYACTTSVARRPSPSRPTSCSCSTTRPRPCRRCTWPTTTTGRKTLSRLGGGVAREEPRRSQPHRPRVPQGLHPLPVRSRGWDRHREARRRASRREQACRRGPGSDMGVRGRPERPGDDGDHVRRPAATAGTIPSSAQPST